MFSCNIFSFINEVRNNAYTYIHAHKRARAHVGVRACRHGWRRHECAHVLCVCVMKLKIHSFQIDLHHFECVKTKNQVDMRFFAHSSSGIILIQIQ